MKQQKKLHQKLNTPDGGASHVREQQDLNERVSRKNGENGGARKSGNRPDDARRFAEAGRERQKVSSGIAGQQDPHGVRLRFGCGLGPVRIEAEDALADGKAEHAFFRAEEQPVFGYGGRVCHEKSLRLCDHDPIIANFTAFRKGGNEKDAIFIKSRSAERNFKSALDRREARCYNV